MQEARKYREFDPGKAEAFGGEFLAALNHGALCLMTSVGHRTGLFDTMSELPPSTADAIAKKAGLNERYVREWLGAMVTGRIVDVDPSTGKCLLPAEHAAYLTRAAAADNLAVFSHYIAVMGCVEDEIVECFFKGGVSPTKNSRDSTRSWRRTAGSPFSRPLNPTSSPSSPD
jgi:hypothetical protein